MTTDVDLERYRLHAEICKVLTDPKRLRLLHALRDGERTVGDLAAVLGIPLPNASQHLGVLRAAGLVESRREGTSVRYRLAEPAILDACDIVWGIVDRRQQARLILATGVHAISAPASTAGTAAPAGPAAPAN